ncbi:YlbL family protein [Nocardioides sp. Soil796]|uniref:YlbL family protein n=1 Tax=Nocardioides sp. Soil796 TaxID=1736412 RepID=UPI00070F8F88|nr:PDZ domain-containing protein [Nocardioides sp. Soil796]KRF10501.1 hypothetical protein ASH02_20605 [Nocardioides sp. Soil796]
MTRRTLAIAISVPLMVALWLTAAIVPVPYVTFTPGVSVDMLSEAGGQERIQVNGHKAFYDDGELRMTTVSVTRAGDSVSVFTAIQAWLSGDNAVQPYSAVYDEDETSESNQQESAYMMTTSQDDAIAASLREMGYTIKPAVEVYTVEKGLPAEGKLQVRDRILSVDGTRISDPAKVGELINQHKADEPVKFVVLRDRKKVSVDITPVKDDGRLRIGILPNAGYTFPFDVSINIDPKIGGPSAGLMFSLAIYDTLTPGSLTGGHHIAGTGTITADGEVGPIGGIQQKIPAVRDAGAQVFLVPSDNCEEALGAERGDVQLIRVKTLKDAIASIKTWVADPDADLPSCEKESK